MTNGVKIEPNGEKKDMDRTDVEAALIFIGIILYSVFVAWVMMSQ